jgi:hypothetical protein
MNWRKCGVVAVLLLATGCGDEKTILTGRLCVSQEQFDEQWPLTVPRGSLSCGIHLGRGKIVSFSVGGDHYILNSNPDSLGVGKSLPLESILRRNPTNPRIPMSIGVLMNEGVKLCAQYSVPEIYKVKCSRVQGATPGLKCLPYKF